MGKLIYTGNMSLDGYTVDPARVALADTHARAIERRRSSGSKPSRRNARR